MFRFIDIQFLPAKFQREDSHVCRTHCRTKPIVNYSQYDFPEKYYLDIKTYTTFLSRLHKRAISGHTLPTFAINGIKLSILTHWHPACQAMALTTDWEIQSYGMNDWIPTNLGNLAPPRLPWPWSWEWATNQNHHKSSSLDPTNCRPPDSSSIPTNHRSPNGPIAIDFRPIQPITSLP